MLNTWKGERAVGWNGCTRKWINYRNSRWSTTGSVITSFEKSWLHDVEPMWPCANTTAWFLANEGRVIAQATCDRAGWKKLPPDISLSHWRKKPHQPTKHTNRGRISCTSSSPPPCPGIDGDSLRSAGSKLTARCDAPALCLPQCKQINNNNKK